MSYINTLVDKVYVINLDKDKDRLEQIDAALRKQNITYERLPATLGSKVTQDSRLTYLCNSFCTDGIKGCALSHHRVWEDALRNGYSKILVFEDDSIIPDDFDVKVRDVVSELPKSYDCIFLGCQFFCRNESFAEKLGHSLMGTAPESLNDSINRVSGSMGSHAVIYTDTFMKKIIHEPIETHIDVQIQRWIKKFNINAYGLNPEIVSTTDPTTSSNLADKFPPLLNAILKPIYVTDKISLSWILSENQFKIAGLNVNLYNILFFLLAIFLPARITLWFFAWILLEILVSFDIKNGFRLFLFTAIGLVLRFSIRGRKF
jgi:GR25 family glycosyltransferase involved in LPS biosynthesis